MTGKDFAEMSEADIHALSDPELSTLVDALYHNLNVPSDYESAVRKHVKALAIFAVCPPAVLFALGWLALWIARGFKRQSV